MDNIRRFGQVATLKPSMIEEYDRLHAAVWPQVLETIHSCNLRNYSIFRRGRVLFAYFEYVGEDYEADMARMAASPETQRWWQHTHPCFEDCEAQRFYEDMREIFHYE